MLYELAVCFRYLRPRISRAYISFNTVISILGIFVGVTTLITVMAVMTGFGNQIRDGFTGFFSHILVFQQDNEPWKGEAGNVNKLTLMKNYPALLERIQKTKGVVAASPFVRVNITMQTSGMSYNFSLRGVDPELEKKTSTIEDRIIEGEFAFPVEELEIESLEPDEEPVKIVSILLGKLIAEETKLKVGDTVRIASNSIGALGKGQRVLTARISGIFSFGTIDQDMYLYSSLETAQVLQNIGNDITGISILTEDLQKADYAKAQLKQELGDGYRVVTWIDMNPELFDLLSQERFIMYFIVTLIIAVAALNIISSLSMMVNEKRKEIGILRSLGAKRRSISVIFSLMGLSIGFFGTGFGVLGGWLLSRYFNNIREWISANFGFKLFSIFKEIPVAHSWFDSLVISAIAMTLCLLTSLYPAWKASRMHPVEALRYE
jgi:lipoprotein-releasing system permease protein